MQNSSTIGRRSRHAVLIAGGLALAFFCGTWSGLMGPGTDGLVRLVYSPLCHQLPERSLEIGGVHQAVCARCSGLYLGGALGLVAALGWLPLGRRRLRPGVLLVVALPTVIDALLPWVGLPGLPNVPRLLLAWPLGLTAGLLLAMGIADLFSAERKVESLEVTHG